jgi:hypothetical protein
MPDFAVQDEPRVGGPRGLWRIFLPFRRLLVRILRPIFLRLAAVLETLDGEQRRLAERQEWMGQQVDALLNRGWDEAALLRRLAALEQQVEELTAQRISPAKEAPEVEGPVSYYCAEPETPDAERPGRPR